MSNWRENDAAAIEHRVEVLNDWLDHTQNLYEMLEYDEEVRLKLLSLAGLIRSRRSDLASTAGRLRAELVTVGQTTNE